MNTDFTLNNCLFGSATLNKNTDLDKFKFTDYDIEFDSRLKFLFTDGSYRKKGTVFGANMSSSVHVDNKGNDTLILGEGPIQGLDDRTLTAEVKYPINYTRSKKVFILSLHCNGSNSFLLLMLQKYINSKQKTQRWKIMHCV